MKVTLFLVLCCCGCRSSHRKYSLGRPDQRDLSENLAATQGLANMITEAQRLFQVQKIQHELSFLITTQSKQTKHSVIQSEC